jgi:hypothetical protein
MNLDLDRRFDERLPLETLLCAYVMDRPKRGLAVDISERGLFLNTLVQDPELPRTPVGLEFNLPGRPETIWAAGETCRDTLDDYFYGMGVRFVAMADLHQRMLREYCRRVRRQRSGLWA